MKKTELLEKVAAGTLSAADLTADEATKLRSELAKEYREMRAKPETAHSDEVRQHAAAIKRIDAIAVEISEFADLDKLTEEQPEAPAAEATTDAPAEGDLVGAVAPAGGAGDAAGATAVAASAGQPLPPIPTGRVPEAPKDKGPAKRTAMVAAASDVVGWTGKDEPLTRDEYARRVGTYTRSLLSDGRKDVGVRTFAHVASFDIDPNDTTKRLSPRNSKDENSRIIRWADEHQIETNADNAVVGRVAAWGGIAEHDFAVETNFERRVELWDKIRSVPAQRSDFNFRPKLSLGVLTGTTAFETRAGIQDLDSTAVLALDGASNKVIVTDIPTVSTETAVAMKVWTRTFRYATTDEIVDPEGLAAQMELQDGLYEVFQDALTYRWLFNDAVGANGVNLTPQFAPTIGGFPGFVQSVLAARSGRGWNKRISVKGYTAVVPAGLKELFVQDELQRAYGTLEGARMSNFDTVLNDLDISMVEYSQDQLNSGLNAIESPIDTQLLVGGFSHTGDTTSGSANVTVSSTVGYVPGMTVTGTGIAAGSKILSITSSTVFVLSANATANGTGVTLTIRPAAIVQPALDGTAVPNQILLEVPVILARFEDWRRADWGVEDWGVDKQFHQDQMRIRHQRAAMFEQFKLDSTLPTIMFTVKILANGGRAGTTTAYTTR